MAFKWLTAEEMVAISGAWVMADQAGRAAIEKIPLLAALLPNLEKGHTDLVQLRSKEAPKLSAISQKETEIDAKHDALVRGMFGTLTMLAPVSDDREELLTLRDKLFPEGLGHTKLSYRGEAGHAAVIAKQLDDTMKARLKAIAVHKKTMLDLVLAWLETGNQLGQLEEEKARLSGASPSLGAETQAARTTWLRLAKALLANAKLAGVDDATDQLLFSALRTAERGTIKPLAPVDGPAAGAISNLWHLSPGPADVTFIFRTRRDRLFQLCTDHRGSMDRKYCRSCRRRECNPALAESWQRLRQTD